MKLGGLGGKESRKIWRREKNIIKNILCTKHLNSKFDIKVGLVRWLSRQT